MPLKIVWAVLDVLTIIILVTGLYLWLRRRKSGPKIEHANALTRSDDRALRPRSP